MCSKNLKFIVLNIYIWYNKTHENFQIQNFSIEGREILSIDFGSQNFQRQFKIVFLIKMIEIKKISSHYEYYREGLEKPDNSPAE
jgi:hypothetical protein